MAGAIVLGLLGPAIEFVKCIAAPIKRHLNYLCCFSSNLQILKEEAEKLKREKEGLEMDVATAKNNARQIDPKVDPWLKQVDEIQQKNSGLEAQVQGRCCLSRYSVGRKVCKTAEAMKQIQEDRRAIINISHDPPAPASMVSDIPGRPMHKFESRAPIEEDIVTALRQGKIVGICGMGGVGKTTLAKNVMYRVREKEKLFDICVMVDISQRIEKEKIQGEIAENLGLELKEKFLSARANVLRSRLTNGEKILIVVDDIWQSLDLEELGIQGCSILLTSRNRHVLTEMDAKLICQMETLTEEEALSFFQEKLGFREDDQNCHSRLAEIAKECNCLPLALACVAGLLKHQQSDIYMLENVLQQLKNANPEDLPEVLDNVYTPLKLSYDHLPNENYKSIFLLCCLLPEDHNIPLEDLTAYAMGLHMFEGISDLEQTRNRTYSIVQNLKTRFLLLEGRDEQYVKMHDVNREVAIYIASKEKHFIKCGDNSTWMSPYLGQRNELSKGSPFPKLRLLLVGNSAGDSDISFEGMNELNVLSIRKNDSLSLVPQFQTNRLRTLIFESCAVKSMCGVGELINLEILICVRCDNINELPLEIKRLERLRLLKISYCRALKKIRKGVLSSLRKLEELEIVESFNEWEVEDNVCLSELECLSNLTCLKIEVKDFNLVAQQISLSPKIKKYDIKVGNVPDCWTDITWYVPNKFWKVMRVHLLVDITLGEWILEYMANAECLYLYGNVSNCLDLGKAQYIRHLRLENCSTISSIAFHQIHLLEGIYLRDVDNLEEIICDIDAPNSLYTNLSSIIVKKCNRLHNLFPLSTTKDCFPQLQDLTILNCHMMEKVFDKNEKNIDIGHGSQHATAITKFPELNRLHLIDLPRLKVFYQGIESIEFPLSTIIQIVGCPHLNASFGGDDNSLQLLCKEKVSRFDNYLRETAPLSTQILIGSFTQLERLTIYDLGNLKSLFSFSMAQNLHRLRSLRIGRCTEMVQVIEVNDEECLHEREMPFPHLEYLHLYELPKLKSFCKWRSCGLNEDENYGKIIIGQSSRPHIAFPTLESMYLRYLPELINFYEGFESTDMPLLTQLDLMSCPKLEGHFCSTTPGETNKQDLDIEDLGKLKSLFSFSMAQNLDRLRRLRIGRCTEMVQVIEVNDEECLHETKLLFPHLVLLQLFGLPKLKSFCKWRSCGLNEDENYGKIIIEQSSRPHIAFPTLVELSLRDLPELINFYEGFESYMPLLTELCLIRCPKLEGHFPITTSGETNKQVVGILFLMDNFSRLKELRIGGFDNTSCLFSASIAPILINLKWLTIEDCENLVKVMEVDESHEKTLFFPCLEVLSLIGLPKLKIFCEWRCAQELPSLKNIEIDSCPEMERFSLGSLTTPILETLKIEHVDIAIRGDLNDALQQYFFGQREKETLREDK